MKTLRVGAVQVFTTLDVSGNLERIVTFLREAARRGVDLLLFPECALSGYAPSESPQGEDNPYDENEIRTAFRELSKEVRTNRIAVVVGTAWYDRKRKAWFNRAVGLQPSGRIAGWSDKVHLFGADERFFRPADRLEPIRVRGVRVGVGICFDLRFPEVWRRLSRRGARVLLNPLAAYGGGEWKVPVMSAHLRSRAAENQRYVVSANSGPRQMALSEIYDPAGLRLASANPEVEEIIHADIHVGRFEAERRRGLPDFLSLVRSELCSRS